MFPSRSSLPALTAFARPGPGASRSPTSSLLFGHRTPSSSSVPPSGLPLGALPRVDACSACPTALAVTPADRASVPVGASAAGHRSTVARIPPRKAEGLPRLLGCPLPCVPQSNIPPVLRELAFSLHGDAAFRRTEPLRTGILVISGLQPCGPHPRLPTLQPPHHWSVCQAGLPACWLGFGRAGFAPAGHLFRISCCHLIGTPS
jgi:hypothetical protein